VLRKILGPNRDEVTGDWRRLPNEELHDLYCSPNVIRVIKRIRWAEHVAFMEKRGGVYEILVENVKGRDHLIDLGVDRWIILKRMLRIEDGKSCTGFIWLRTGTLQVAGFFLWVWNCTFRLYEVWEISWLDMGISVSKEGLCQFS